MRIQRFSCTDFGAGTGPENRQVLEGLLGSDLQSGDRSEEVWGYGVWRGWQTRTWL